MTTACAPTAFLFPDATSSSSSSSSSADSATIFHDAHIDWQQRGHGCLDPHTLRVTRGHVAASDAACSGSWLWKQTIKGKSHKTTAKKGRSRGVKFKSIQLCIPKGLIDHSIDLRETGAQRSKTDRTSETPCEKRVPS